MTKQKPSDFINATNNDEESSLSTLGGNDPLGNSYINQGIDENSKVYMKNPKQRGEERFSYQSTDEEEEGLRRPKRPSSNSSDENAVNSTNPNEKPWEDVIILFHEAQERGHILNHLIDNNYTPNSPYSTSTKNLIKSFETMLCILESKLRVLNLESRRSELEVMQVSNVYKRLKKRVQLKLNKNQISKELATIEHLINKKDKSVENAWKNWSFPDIEHSYYHNLDEISSELEFILESKRLIAKLNTCLLYTKKTMINGEKLSEEEMKKFSEAVNSNERNSNEKPFKYENSLDRISRGVFRIMNF